MPRYQVDYRNGESGMLHTSVTLTAPDQDTARVWADEQVKVGCGAGTSADGAQSTTTLPRFTVAVNEIQ